MMPSFQYIRAGSVEEALKHLTSEQTKIHAGGTDLLGCLRDGVFAAANVVSITGIKDLRGIVHEGKTVRMGAMTTIADVAENPTVRKLYPALARAAAEVASPQLRSQGTIGGNICQKPRCWYYRGEFHCLRKGGNTCFAFSGENQYHCIFGGAGCYIVHPSDTAPALAAYKAAVQISGPNRIRSVPVEEFFTPPAKDPRRETVLESEEIVTEIVIPAPPANLKSSYRKVRARRSWDFALAGIAMALHFTGNTVSEARIFLSGAAPIPWRSKEMEQEIIGRQLTGETIARASAAVVKGAQPLAKNTYKIPLFRAIAEEELQAISWA